MRSNMRIPSVRYSVITAILIGIGILIGHFMLPIERDILIKQSGTQVEFKRYWYSELFAGEKLTVEDDYVYTFKSEEDCDKYIEQYKEEKKLPIEVIQEKDKADRVVFRMRPKGIVTEWEPKRSFIYDPISEGYSIFESQFEAEQALDKRNKEIKQIADNCDKYREVAKEMNQ